MTFIRESHLTELPCGQYMAPLATVLVGKLTEHQYNRRRQRGLDSRGFWGEVSHSSPMQALPREIVPCDKARIPHSCIPAPS